MQTTSAISHARRRPGLFRRLRLRAGDDLPSLKPQTQRTYGSSRPKDPKAPVNLQILENDESLLGFRVCNPIPSDLVHRAPTFRGAIFEKMRTRSMDVLFDSPFSFWCSGFGESARPLKAIRSLRGADRQEPCCGDEPQLDRKVFRPSLEVPSFGLVT